MAMDLAMAGHKSLFTRITQPAFLRYKAKGLARIMDDFTDERRYAWRMIRAARQAQSQEEQTGGVPVGRDDVAVLLYDALDAGLDRAELIIELADLGARFFTLCAPVAPPVKVAKTDVDTGEAMSI
jgi:hypothetical protein